MKNGTQNDTELDQAGREQEESKLPHGSTYLGDSVYARFDGWSIILFTDNGFGPDHTIYMEPAVLAALDAYIERLKKPVGGDNAL